MYGYLVECGSQNITLWNLFFPSIFICILGVELRSSWQHCKCSTHWKILFTLKSIDIRFKFTNLTMHFIVLGIEPKSLNVWFKQFTTESHTLPEKVFNITLQRICIHWYQFSIILIIFYVSLQKKIILINPNVFKSQMFEKILAKKWSFYNKNTKKLRVRFVYISHHFVWLTKISASTFFLHSNPVFVYLTK